MAGILASSEPVGQHQLLRPASNVSAPQQYPLRESAHSEDDEAMNNTPLTLDLEVRCRCGQMGVISGVQGPAENPEFVWVSHMVRLAMQTHIHRSAQMPALLAQTSR